MSIASIGCRMKTHKETSREKFTYTNPMMIEVTCWRVRGETYDEDGTLLTEWIKYEDITSDVEVP
jgi:hypothetical protein